MFRPWVSKILKGLLSVVLFLNVVILFILCFWVASVDYFGVVLLSLGSIVSSYFDISFSICNYNVYIVLMLLVCSNISLLFNFHYYGGYNEDSSSLMKLLVFFILVMFMLVGTDNLFSSLVFWEYLGLVSFLLVSFYDSSTSLRGGIVTLVSSRFGDVAFFLLLSWVFCGGGVSILFYLLCWVIIASKSACFPFGSWLLEAMRAPTPVSSLVHSSTLVAAGVWFMSCYYDSLFFSDFYLFMLGGCLLTILFSGFSALVNGDIKQVVALSTCNNISWVLLIGLQGDIQLSIFQLMIHAVSKCLLFTYVGDYIVSSGGGQSASQINVGYYGNFFLVYILILLLGLSGLPFIGLYFSKHLFLCVLGYYNMVNLIIIFFLWFCISLSCSYCTRLFFFFFNRELFFVGGYRCCFIGGWLVMLSVGFYSVGWIYDVELCHLGYLFTCYLFSSIISGIAFGFYSFSVVWGGCWVRFLFGQDLLVQIFEYVILYFSRFVCLSLFRWESGLFYYLCGMLRGNGFSDYFGINSVFCGVVLVFLFFLI